MTESNKNGPAATGRGSDRRGEADRRIGGDRRRSAELRTPLIHITPDALYVLVIVESSGDRPTIGICRSIPWRVDADSLHDKQGENELAAALAKLANEERLSGARVEVLLSSDLCVTRAVTGVSDNVAREASALRERSQLYLSLGPGKKVIATSSTPLDARHSHALLTVATEQTLDAIHRAVQSSGLELGAIRSAQVCLARTVQADTDSGQAAALVVGVENRRVEIGVMSGGRLFLDYRPGGDTRGHQLADLLSQHHTRLQRYCQRHHGLDHEKLSRVVVSGPLDEARRAAATVATLRELDVHLLDLGGLELPWQHRGDQLGPEMAAVVGAALALVDENGDRGPNLVDELITQARPPIARMLVRKLAPLAAAIVLAAVFGVLDWNARTHSASMRADLDLLAPQAARAAELRLELIAGQGEMDQLKALAAQLVEPASGLMLRNLTQSIPNQVWLSSLRFQDGAASLSGASYSESGIYDMVGHLQHVPGVAEVALQGTGMGRTANRNATTFDIHLDLDAWCAKASNEGVQ